MGEPVSGALIAAMTGVAAARQAAAQAVKASGAIVRLEPDEWQRISAMASAPVIVTAPAGLGGKKVQYLISFKGFVFHCISRTALPLPGDAVLITAKKIWIP